MPELNPIYPNYDYNSIIEGVEALYFVQYLII